MLILVLIAIVAGLAWELIGPAQRSRLRQRLLALRERPAPTDPALEAPQNAADDVAAIQVFFAPSEPLNPWGVDDRFVAYLETAQESVYCACYEFEYLPAAEVLIRKHRAGLRVGLVSDSDYADEAAVQACADAGIRVVFDERSGFMHDKFCIVDGDRVWTGSTNITENGFFRNNNNALLIRSAPLGQNYLREFDEMWRGKDFGGRSPAATPYPVLELEGIFMECHFAPEDHVEREILAEVNAAVKAIDFMAFSFTSEPVAEAMAGRIAAGVQVRGLFESRNAGSRYSRDDYLRAHGAAIYLDGNPYNMHHKVVVIDGGVVITGSYNFSKSAEKENDENVLIIRDPALAGAYTAEFERLVQPVP
ncbi:MAG: phospholipase [Candidatus Hydrogenedentes bacterium]|nr:phospholipase [Candidatus Hydrogenedentota bacterium]